jgi:hypothetical protein
MPIVLISRVYRERQVMMMIMIWCRIPRKRATEREREIWSLGQSSESDRWPSLLDPCSGNHLGITTFYSQPQFRSFVEIRAQGDEGVSKDPSRSSKLVLVGTWRKLTIDRQNVQLEDSVRRSNWWLGILWWCQMVSGVHWRGSGGFKKVHPSLRGCSC